MLLLTWAYAGAAWGEAPGITDPWAQAAASDLVFEGTVERVRYDAPDGEGGLPLTRYEVLILDPIKGEVQSGRVLLTVPGGPLSDGSWIHVAGAPRIEVGDVLIAHARVMDDQHGRLQNWSIGLLVLVDTPETVVVDGGDRVLAALDYAEPATYLVEDDAPPDVSEEATVERTSIDVATHAAVRDAVYEAVYDSTGAGAPPAFIAGFQEAP